MCVCVWATLLSTNLDDESLLEFTDLFVYWCFKCRCSPTAAQMGKHIDVFTRDFFMMMKIFGYVLKVFLFFSISLFSFCFFFSFSIRQQSLEWSSHPCKGVNARLRVYACVCVQLCARWTKHTRNSPGEGFWCESYSGQGWKQLSHCEGTNPTQALSNTKTTEKKHEEQKYKKTNKTVCKEISCLDFVHLDAFIGERPHLHYLHGHRRCIYFGEIPLPSLSACWFVFLFVQQLMCDNHQLYPTWGMFYLWSSIVNEGI